MEPKDQAMLEALKTIAEGQKQIVDEIKKLSTVGGGDLVAIKLPDGKVGLVPRSALQASTQGAKTGGLKSVEHEPILRDPWPDPSQPKPPGYGTAGGTKS